MRTILLALALLSVAPLAHAQIVIQTPQLRPIGPPRGDDEDYWRHRRDGDREDEWHHRREVRDEEYRREEWRRAHCVRDYRGEEYCRR